MNRKVIFVSIAVVVMLIIVMVISYIITSNSDLVVNVDNELDEIPLEIPSSFEENSSDEDEYRVISKDSQLASDIFEFVPKYLQNVNNKNSNEYIIYSSISKLEEQDIAKETYSFLEGEFLGYKSNIIINKAKEIFGNEIKIDKKEQYNLPIGYSKESDAFCIYPMGFGSSEEFQVIKELKENNKTYILTLYALNIEYDVNDLNNIYISTNDTLALYSRQDVSEEQLRASMRKYTLDGIEIDALHIVNEYKNVLPVIEYELEKLNDRGTEYFVKNIKFVVN